MYVAPSVLVAVLFPLFLNPLDKKSISAPVSNSALSRLGARAVSITLVLPLLLSYKYQSSVDDDLFLKRTVSTTETTLGSTTAWLQYTDSAGSPNYVQAYPTYQVAGIYHLDKDDTVHVAVYTEGGACIASSGDQAYFQGFQIA